MRRPGTTTSGGGLVLRPHRLVHRGLSRRATTAGPCDVRARTGRRALVLRPGRLARLLTHRFLLLVAAPRFQARCSPAAPTSPADRPGAAVPGRLDPGRRGDPGAPAAA